jgi:tail-anchored protein insertion receptor
MVSLLLVVFILELISYIIITIGSKPINDLLWQIYCRTGLGPSKDFSEQMRLRREVVSLKREMASISAQDEFSKWAKIRRKHDKALEEHDKKGTQPTCLAGFMC